MIIKFRTHAADHFCKVGDSVLVVWSNTLLKTLGASHNMTALCLARNLPQWCPESKFRIALPEFHHPRSNVDTKIKNALEGQKKRIKKLQNKEVFRNSQLCDSLQRGKKPSNVECNHVKHALERNLARLWCFWVKMFLFRQRSFWETKGTGIIVVIDFCACKRGKSTQKAPVRHRISAA